MKASFEKLDIKFIDDIIKLNLSVKEPHKIIANSLTTISTNWAKLSNELNRLYDYDFMNFLNTQISNIKQIFDEIQK